MRAVPVLASILAAAMLAPTLVASQHEPGRWEVLGEDGAVFVPDAPPTTTALPPPGLGAYHDPEELGAALAALAAARPDIVSLSNLGATVEGRPVWAVTLHAGPQDGRPALLFDGAHHGDEVIASEILLRYATTLANGYPSDARSRAILESVTLVIVPMVNPDGAARAHTAPHYAEARKNANGVDVNRNYNHSWGLPGASASPGDATYRGPSPGSEPETQAMMRLMASRNWTFYSSLHSGAEMILWPLGYTTNPPAENAVYTRLGNELTAITQAPNGQVSRILYGVSGDSMDHAYGGAGPDWRPLATSPETYEGNGNAFDWWPLFNPPETEAGIAPVVARWTGFLDHLAREAAHYAPRPMSAPAPVVGPGAPFQLETTLTSPPKRPFLGANVTALAPGFLDVVTPNPLVLGALNGTATASWTLAPESGGEGVVTLRAALGPVGNLTTSAPVRITAPAISLSLDRATAGSGETVAVTLRATSDVALAGAATVRFRDVVLDARNVTVDAGGAQTWRVDLATGASPAGAHEVSAELAYDTPEGGGAVRASATLTLVRPQLALTRAAPASVAPGEAFLMTVTARNVGTMTARNVTLEERIPIGYALAPRDAGIPLPADPLARPAPKRSEVGDDGRVTLAWDVLGLAPGSSFSYQLKLVPLVPGEHTLETALRYDASYLGRGYGYEESATSGQVVRGP